MIMNASNARPTQFDPCCLATTIGSLPHTDVGAGMDLIFEHTPEIPAWPQFPKRAFEENMMVQFTEGMPGLVQNGEQFSFDSSASEFSDQMTRFYTDYLAVTEDGDAVALDRFALSAGFAAGFEGFCTMLEKGPASFSALKGQVTGPFTLGTNLSDQDDRCAYYDEQLRDAIVKMAALKAMWQISRLSRFQRRVIILIDEPALLGFGSQLFITVSREDIIRDLNEVAEAIHAQGGLAGIHCEANTDWSMLMETDLDILVFDAYDHLQAITLYPDRLQAFLAKGGSLGWGIVPTLDRESAAKETTDALLVRFDDGLEELAQKGFDRELLLQRALITPSCGAGGVLTVALAERVLRILRELSLRLRERHGF